MQAKKGTRVKASNDIKTRFQRIHAGTTGTVIAVHPDGFTVEWDDTSLLKSAFDSGASSRKLEVLENEDGE